jgi:glycosyltransferase involved in cell wall biosynthesis
VLTVAVDATPLLGDRTGIGVAVTGMVRELATRDDLSLVGYGLTTRGWARLRHALPSGVRLSRAPMPASPLLRAWSRVDLPVAEWWTGRVDVVHGTNFVVPPARGAERVVSVWDLTAERYPEMCTPTARRYPELIRRAVAGGAWVHTGAHSMAAEISDFFGVEPGRVRVVAPGIAQDAGPGPTHGGANPPAGPGTSRPYILGLGTTEPRKDFPGLVAAFGLIAASHPDLELRITGPRGWAEDEVAAAIAASPYKERIRRTGWVSDVQPVLRGASLFAYPSVYEGFGFPPLEAMALGVPVVATAVGALPEVLGDAAALVPAGDPAGLAGAMERVLTEDGYRRRLVEAGLARASLYTWEGAAESLMALYRDMVS